MATYMAEPKIYLSVHFGDPVLMGRFDVWFVTACGKLPLDVLPRTYGRHGRSGFLDVVDAEKVVAWLNANGVRPIGAPVEQQ